MMNVIDPSNEYVVLYLSESGQLVKKFEKLMMESDQSGELKDAAELFRILHTLKGTSAMMDFTPLVELAHSFEDILAVLKALPQTLDSSKLRILVDAGIEFSAYFNAELARINNAAAPIKNEKLLTDVENLAAALGVASKSVAATPAAEKNAVKTVQATPENKKPHGDDKLWMLVKLKKCPLPNIRASIIAKSVAKLCSCLVTNPENIDKAAMSAEAILSSGFEIGFVPQPDYEVQDVVRKISSQPYVASCQLQNVQAAQAEVSQDEVLQQLQTMTVAQTLVNNLTDLMGEIISAEAAVEAYAKEAGYASRRMQELLSTLRRTVAEANIVTSQIGTHDVGDVFMQMQRAIRSLAREQKKEIKVEIVGSDVQVDKSILQILSDSLIHMVRNAADHGIEMPDVREAHGKPREGRITLSAVKKNDYLTVTVSDDGAGINRRAVLEKAEQRGKLTKPKELYSDKEIGNLLLFSGVSTNEQVTQYSGRGVGLNTVVRRVRQAGGMVFIESKEGQGTTFTLSIPITLLMIDGVEVTLMDGSEMIIPANAIQHICITDSAPEQFAYQEKSYSHMLFPTQKSGVDDGGGYSVLFERDFGPYYVRAKHVSMMSSYYVKQMPEFVVDALGRGDIYSGCVLRSDAKLCCVLDVAKLIGAAEISELSERQANL